MASPFPQKIPGEIVEDCRDYLRTGRCKYGASCKFNHPPNVQSGGGMKTPIDPSEPLFPIRPNEPVCQYYMKHGTCKFGQACKFHHPPQSSLTTAATIVGSNAIFIPRSNDGGSLPQHILLNPVGNDQSSSTMMLQFLPQRPDEPDCLYFLRNGTCKYGATCRYHHPINHQQRKSVEVPRRHQSVVQLPAHVSSDGTVQFVQTQPTFSTPNSRVVSTSGGAHVLVTETPIQVMSVNNGGGFQQVAVPVSNGEIGNDFGTSIGQAVGAGIAGMSQEHASSSSSIASSYETASSSLEFVQGQGNWNRPKRTSSGGSLSAYAEVQPIRQPTVPGGNRMVDNSSNSRRLRAASFGSIGSTSDQSGYHEGVVGWSGGSVPNGQLPVHQERFSEGGHAFEQPRRQYRSESFESRNTVREEHPQQRHPQDHRIPRQGPPRQRQTGDMVDHGLSMMTSALLNMLDTPEEAAAKSYPSRISSSSTLNNSTSPPVTPRSGNVYSPQHNVQQHHVVQRDHHFPQPISQGNLYQPEGRQNIVYTTAQHHGVNPHVRLEPATRPAFSHVSSKQDPLYNNETEQFEEGEPTAIPRQWSSNWRESVVQPVGQSAQVKPGLEHRSSNGPPSPQTNVGLFLS